MKYQLGGPLRQRMNKRADGYRRTCFACNNLPKLRPKDHLIDQRVFLFVLQSSAKCVTVKIVSLKKVVVKKQPICLVRAKTQYDLATTFMRFQEYYESPKFRGKIFTAQEYAAWYAEQNGSFSYVTDWSGFNIPSRVLTPFYNGQFDPLSQKERKLLRLLKNIRGRFYVIGVQTGAETHHGTLKHEFVHGLFYTNPTYRKAVKKVLKKTDATELKNLLKKKHGYHSTVIPDEINAYVLTGIFTLGRIRNTKMLARLRTKLQAIFKKYFGFSIETASCDLILKQIHCLRLG